MKKDKIYGNSVHSPCKDCPDRTPTCHSDECPHGWNDFKRRLYEEKQARYKIYAAESRITAHEVESKRRTLKRQGKI